jgi:hypothetical protein
MTSWARRRRARRAVPRRRQRLALQDHRARVAGQMAGEKARQGRLAAARGADDSDRAALAQGQRHVVDGGDLPALAAEGL